MNGIDGIRILKERHPDVLIRRLRSHLAVIVHHRIV
jgi:hypothetical protein